MRNYLLRVCDMNINFDDRPLEFVQGTQAAVEFRAIQLAGIYRCLVVALEVNGLGTFFVNPEGHLRYAEEQERNVALL